MKPKTFETWYRAFGTRIDTVEVERVTPMHVLLKGMKVKFPKTSNGDCYFPTLQEAEAYRLQWLKNKYGATEKSIEECKVKIQYYEARLRDIKKEIQNYENKTV